MKSRFHFKNWTAAALTALCLVSTPLGADEILLNANFSKETDSWSGDFSNDPDTDDPFQPRTTGQISINLREHHAVRIFQAFMADAENLVCTVSFTLSSGGSYTGSAKVSDVASDVRVNQVSSSSFNPATSVVTVQLNANYGTYESSFKSPVLIMADPDDSKVLLYPLGTPVNSGSMPMTSNNGTAANSGFMPMTRPMTSRNGTAAPTPASDAAGTTFTVHMNVKAHRSYRLYLAFPPGTGTVTVTKISLQPDTQ